MSAKRGRSKWNRPHRPVVGQFAAQQTEIGPDGYDYCVRQLPAARAVKTYRCPGCDHEIRSGTAHVVVWPADLGERGADERRHWHTPCWANRGNRGPTRKWS